MGAIVGLDTGMLVAGLQVGNPEGIIGVVPSLAIQPPLAMKVLIMTEETLFNQYPSLVHTLR